MTTQKPVARHRYGCFSHYAMSCLPMLVMIKGRERCAARAPLAQVRGYPTLILFKDGDRRGQYSGPRSFDKLVEYLEDETGLSPSDGTGASEHDEL